MRNTSDVFHLAIPTHDLDLAAKFYGVDLGCKVARRYDDRITINFFGDQVVCHLAPESIDKYPKMYPRHFGVTFAKREDFYAVHTRALRQELRLFADLFVRFPDKREEHHTFFLIDPSNNLLEFKYYVDPAMMY